MPIKYLTFALGIGWFLTVALFLAFGARIFDNPKLIAENAVLKSEVHHMLPIIATQRAIIANSKKPGDRDAILAFELMDQEQKAHERALFALQTKK